MTYQHQDLNSRQAQKIFGIAPYVGQYTQYGAQTSAINGFGAYSEGVYQPHGQSDPGRDPVSAAFKHRQAIPQQTAQERAYAVSIPAQPTTSDPVNGHYSKPIASQPASSTLPIDYQLLLLSLSDEYLAAAYGHGAMADITRREVEMEDYHKLIATGLGCLEALLKHFRLSPEREAVVRLRYATVLYEETENTIEAEESLSKGIIICDRHRFFDLKYDMQHLLARILFEKNQRAAFKYLDNMINDAEAYQHIAWVYVFRFLRVFLHLELSSHQDLVAALNQLRSIIYMSNDYGDKTVLAVAKALEALTYLRNPTDAEYVEQAQRALAGVRSLQLDPAIGELHQLAVLTSFVDLCCHLQRFEPQQANMKLQVMRNALSTVDTGPSWTDDGTFAIPIPKARMPSCKSSSGVIREQHDANSLVLMFSWMPKQDIYNVGYLLSGVTMAHRNTTDGQKSEHMFEQGIQRLECMYLLLISLFGFTNSR